MNEREGWEAAKVEVGRSIGDVSGGNRKMLIYIGRADKVVDRLRLNVRCRRSLRQVTLETRGLPSAELKSRT